MAPLAERGFEVFFTNRWPGMPVDITFAEVAEGHARAILEHFGGPVDVVGHSTGGSVLLQLIADRPDAVRRAVVACAAYRLGPVAKRGQLSHARRHRAHRKAVRGLDGRGAGGHGALRVGCGAY